MKFTATVVRSLTLPSGKRDYIEFDDDVPGFGIRIREGGSRVWVFQYKLGNKQRRMTLGSVKALDVGRARETAKDLHAAVRLGRDPAAEKGDARSRRPKPLKPLCACFWSSRKHACARARTPM
jgi:hypothetical protein